MFKRKRIKGQITIYKHFTENSSSRNTNPTKKLGVILGAPEGLPCQLHVWHPSCYKLALLSRHNWHVLQFLNKFPIAWPICPSENRLSRVEVEKFGWWSSPEDISTLTRGSLTLLFRTSNLNSTGRKHSHMFGCLQNIWLACLFTSFLIGVKSVYKTKSKYLLFVNVQAYGWHIYFIVYLKLFQSTFRLVVFCFVCFLFFFGGEC